MRSLVQGSLDVLRFMSTVVILYLDSLKVWRHFVLLVTM